MFPNLTTQRVFENTTCARPYNAILNVKCLFVNLRASANLNSSHFSKFTTNYAKGLLMDINEDLIPSTFSLVHLFLQILHNAQKKKRKMSYGVFF